MFLDMIDFDTGVEGLLDTKNNKCEKLICSFDAGYTARKYRIYVKSELDEKESVGYTDYQEAKIYLKFLDLHLLHKTLIHELTHVWLYENGHNQSDRQFDNEDICEINANSYDFIYDILKLFYSELFNYHKNYGKHCKE